ncbi:MAG: sensor histidine kinase [Ruminococcaceae bacterium]|nr:sensor histidine kinase [Oscillospiraceae bacterium]
MDDLSLYVLDITMNSVRAGAENIDISLVEEGEWLTFSVTDDGCGMSAEQVAKLSDPFFTTRKTRKVGLGIPFLKMLAEMTGGGVEIKSTPEAESPDSHGTVVKATFGRDHIDFIPLGDMVETVKTLIQGSPDINFTYTHKMADREVRLSCAELRAILGDDISLAAFEILEWIDGFLREQYGSEEQA